MGWAILSHVMGGHNQNLYYEHLKVQIEDNIQIYRYYRWISNISRTQTQNWNVSRLKGAVSYRFSQGLLTLMCNNSKLKADIIFFFFCCVDKHPKSITGCKNLRFNTRWLCYSVWGKTHVFHNYGFNSETIVPIPIFLFDNDKYMPSPQNGIRVCQLELYFWKYFIFCIKYIFFPVFSFSS